MTRLIRDTCPDSSQRVSEGTRTPDRLDHNQELYQLSYAHRVRRSIYQRPVESPLAGSSAGPPAGWVSDVYPGRAHGDQDPRPRGPMLARAWRGGRLMARSR